MIDNFSIPDDARDFRGSVDGGKGLLVGIDEEGESRGGEGRVSNEVRSDDDHAGVGPDLSEVGEVAISCKSRLPDRVRYAVSRTRTVRLDPTLNATLIGEERIEKVSTRSPFYKQSWR